MIPMRPPGRRHEGATSNSFFNNFDQSFVEDSRLWIVGTGSQPDLPPERVYTFTDPITGVSYGAIKFADHVGAGMAVLQRAMVMRSYTKYCDETTATASADDDCQPIDERSKAFITAELLDHLELIKVMADLHPLLHVSSPYN